MTDRDTLRRMRAMVAVVLSMAGCVSASATPLAPRGPGDSAPETAHQDKVALASTPQLKVSPTEPTSSAPAPVGSAPASPPAATLVTIADKGAAKVQLLNAGAEPRTVLRYVFHQGESIPFRIRTDMEMDTIVSVSGLSSSQAPRSMHQILPTTECTGITNTKRVDADGTAHRNGSLFGMNVLARQGVLPAVQTKMEEMLRGVGNIAFDDVIDARGQISDSHMDLSAVREPTMLESMQQMADGMSALTMPWPAEPVGVGAKWQVLSNYGKGKSYARDMIVSLVSMKGKKLKLETTSSVTGTPSTVVKNGATVELKATGSTGTGKLDVSLDPLLMHSTSTTRTKTESSTNGVAIQMDLEIVTEFHSGP